MVEAPFTSMGKPRVKDVIINKTKGGHITDVRGDVLLSNVMGNLVLADESCMLCG